MKKGERAVKLTPNRSLTQIPMMTTRSSAHHEMSTEKKIDKAISKGFGKVKGRFLQKSRPDDVKPVRTSPLDVERKRADELELRAASSSAAIKSIESLIIQLAEKWKPEMSDLYAKVDEYRREHEGDPEILPVVLVDILIKSYEKEVRAPFFPRRISTLLKQHNWANSRVVEAQETFGEMGFRNVG